MLFTFFEWSASNTEEMLGFMGNLITDLTPLLTPIIAVGLGLIIFAVIVGVIRGHQ
jgi:hypothetical protein